METKKLKKFDVTIEQPLCRTWEVEAESAEEALEIARDKYNKEEFVLMSDDTGTDAQVKVDSQELNEYEDAKESIDWTYL